MTITNQQALAAYEKMQEWTFTKEEAGDIYFRMLNNNVTFYKAIQEHIALWIEIEKLSLYENPATYVIDEEFALFMSKLKTFSDYFHTISRISEWQWNMFQMFMLCSTDQDDFI